MNVMVKKCLTGLSLQFLAKKRKRKKEQNTLTTGGQTQEAKFKKEDPKTNH